MEIQNPRPCLRVTLLLERYYEEGARRPVVCRLWRMAATAPAGQIPPRPPVYALGLESPTRRYLYCLGEEEDSARRLLEAVTEGRLAPIHLRDVVEDYRWDREGGAREDRAEEFAVNPLQIPPNMV